MARYVATLTAVLLSICLGGSALAQPVPPDPGAAANVRQSEQYEQALRGNSAFRAKRMQQECGPVTDPELHQQCIASFGGDGTSPPTKKRKQ
jgi:hypothetical protein